MDSIGEKFESSHDIGVCITNTLGKVISQNNLCLEILGRIDKLDMLFNELELEDLTSVQSMGTQFFRGKNINNKDVDILVINDGKEIMIIFYLLEKKFQNELFYLKDKGLTKRELEVAGYVVKGQKNKDICEALHISKDTLKSHLNKIYKKIPEEKIVSWR